MRQQQAAAAKAAAAASSGKGGGWATGRPNGGFGKGGGSFALGKRERSGLSSPELSLA